MTAIVHDPFNIVITGVGGQGNVLASQILGQSLVQIGRIVTVGETYGASQRGGSVMSHLRVSLLGQWSPLIPVGQAHMVVGLEPLETLRVMEDYGNPDVLTLTNTRPIHPLDVIAGSATYPEMDDLLGHIRNLSQRTWTVDATNIALEMGNPILSNMAMLGAISALQLEQLPLERSDFEDALAMLLPDKAVALNMDAFDLGRDSAKEI
jgi:indolepyruvate ferredoxin oxidoreductase, beta subunit